MTAPWGSMSAEMASMRKQDEVALPGSMPSAPPRYEVVLDPADLFLIWDSLAECPASLDAGLAVCGTVAQARVLAALLNRAAADGRSG